MRESELIDLFTRERRALKGGDDGGMSGGMEHRIARLEAHAEHAQTDLSDLKQDMRDVRDRLRGLEVKVEHLPSKGFIAVAVSAGIGLTSAVITLAVAYQDFLAGLTR